MIPSLKKVIKLMWPLVLAASLCVMAGCTVRVADLTLVSTKNIDLSNTQLDARKGMRVKGEDCAYAILGLIPLGIPNLQEAIDNALEKANGNIMIDEVTSYKGFYFILASQSCIEVEGTVINISKKM